MTTSATHRRFFRWTASIGLAAVTLGPSIWASAGVTSELQHSVRESTFEVVMKKPEKDTASYEKPLPLELLPYYDRNDAYRSVGTAFSLGHNRYVTAAHVIIAGISSQFGAPELRRSDGTVFAIDQILKFSQHEDFVLFSLRNDPASPGLEVDTAPKIDEPVLAVGDALGEGIVIRDGLFTSETPEDQDGLWKWIRFSAAASPGNSGGPLLNADGKVIGIVIGKSPNENLNYALPIVRVIEGEELKARFNQRILVSLPFLHSTYTYSYKDEYKLPLPWTAFEESFQSVTEHQIDKAHSTLLDRYADSSFPKGAGSEDILYEPEPNNFRPRLIAQQADGRWNAFPLEYHTTQLPGNGSVSVANAAGAIFLQLVRSDAAEGGDYYTDSASFMNTALRALNLRRPVGPDQVVVTSLGTARSQSMFVDKYGRKWQSRVWAMPSMDIYVVGELLPTPDGYVAVVQFAPSVLLHEVEKEIRLLANQVDVSYHGTLAQWQAHLQRRELLADALKDVKLLHDPSWQLQTPRFKMTLPPDALMLTDKSILTLTMGFLDDGAGVSWGIHEARWNRDERQDVAISLRRRQRPPPAARLELRNRFADMAIRRSPFDGSMDRESADIYSLSTVIDVPGKKAGTVSADLLYGVTVYLGNHPTMQDALNTTQRVAANIHVLEPGIGPDIAKASTFDAPADAEFETIKRAALASASDYDAKTGPDIRGRHFSDDLRDYYAMIQAEIRSTPLGGQEMDPAAWKEKQLERQTLLQKYWGHYPALIRNRDVWPIFLSRNHLPPATPHSIDVVIAEQALLTLLKSRIPTEEWSVDARRLLEAYIGERDRLVRSSTQTPGEYRLRTTPCPVASTQTSGGRFPKYSPDNRPIEELWPKASRRLGEEGTVIASYKISATGCVTSAAIVGSSGFDMLDNTVLQFSESARFIPADAHGAAVDAVVKVPIVFKLSP